MEKDFFWFSIGEIKEFPQEYILLKSQSRS